MHIHIPVYMHGHRHVGIHIHIPVHLYVYVCTYTYTYTCTYTYTHVHVHIQHVHVHICNIDICTCANTHYKQIRTATNTHTYTARSLDVDSFKLCCRYRSKFTTIVKYIEYIACIYLYIYIGNIADLGSFQNYVPSTPGWLYLYTCVWGSSDFVQLWGGFLRESETSHTQFPTLLSSEVRHGCHVEL